MKCRKRKDVWPVDENFHKVSLSEEQQQLFYGPLSGTTQLSTRRNIYPLAPVMIINDPLSASFMYYNPWHPHCSIYLLNSLFAQPLSKSCLVYHRVWNPPLHTPYFYSPNKLSSFHNTFPHHRSLICCSTVIMSSVQSLCLISTWNSIFYRNVTHLFDHFHLCPLKCLLIFFLRSRSHFYAM